MLFNRFLLREETDYETSGGVDHITQFRRAFSPVGRSGHLLGGDRRIDAAPSFSDRSVSTEITATPFHRKDLKIRANTCTMLWYSGLRGAVSYACSRTFPDDSAYKSDFVNTTMALVVFTVFVLGGTTELALSALKIDVGVDEETYVRESLREPVVSNAVTNFEKNHVFPLVVRDYHVMHGIEESQLESETFQPRRPRTPIDPKIEMTESGYLDTMKVADMKVTDQIELLVRQDTLFDYGAQ